MATKEKIVDLKSKPEKITDEQLEQVQKLVNNINRGQLEVGAMELQKHENMHAVTSLRGELEVLQNDLKEEYGTVDINIQNGTINYKEDVEADKED